MNAPIAPLTSDRATLRSLWRRALAGDVLIEPIHAVVAELSEYFRLPPEEVHRRCVRWEEYALREWQAGDRSTPEGLLDFYRTQVSWIFGALWRHTDQFHGDLDTIEFGRRLLPSDA